MLEEEKADRRTERMSGCAGLGKWVLRLITFLAFVAIALLLIMEFPSQCTHGPGQAQRDKNANKHQIHALAAGLSHFHTEYNRLPLQTDSDSDLSTTAGHALLLPLLGQDQTTNPRNIKFVDFPVARDGRFGISGDPPTLVDSWNQPYHIILDTNNDGVIANPEAGANPKAEPALKARAAIYSSGPDRDPKTWKDNITNWR